MHPEIVGRRAELAAIITAVEADDEPRFRALVLEGVPGIGKTTLWRAGVMRAERSGALVLTARPTLRRLVSPTRRSAISFAEPADALEGLPAPVGPLYGRRRCSRETRSFRTVVWSPGACRSPASAGNRRSSRCRCRRRAMAGCRVESRDRIRTSPAERGAGAAGPPSTCRDEHRARGLVAAIRRGSRAGRAAEPFRAARDPGRAHPCTPASSGARQDLARIGRQPVLRDRARQGADPGGDTREAFGRASARRNSTHG